MSYLQKKAAASAVPGRIIAPGEFNNFNSDYWRIVNTSYDPDCIVTAANNSLRIQSLNAIAHTNDSGFVIGALFIPVIYPEMDPVTGYMTMVVECTLGAILNASLGSQYHPYLGLFYLSDIRNIASMFGLTRWHYPNEAGVVHCTATGNLTDLCGSSTFNSESLIPTSPAYAAGIKLRMSINYGITEVHNITLDTSIDDGVSWIPYSTAVFAGYAGDISRGLKFGVGFINYWFPAGADLSVIGFEIKKGIILN